MSKAKDHRTAVEEELHKDTRIASWQWEVRGSGHQGCKFVLTNGKRGTLIITSTASDHRSLLNDLRDTRRAIREAWDR